MTRSALALVLVLAGCAEPARPVAVADPILPHLQCGESIPGHGYTSSSSLPSEPAAGVVVA